MSQSRAGSVIEAFVNVLIGYLVSVAANIVFLPVFGYDVKISDAFGIGLVFTIISLVRSYLLRRLFNKFQ